MTINDGFGEGSPFEGLTDEEIVQRYERLAHKVANDSARGPYGFTIHDDLVQEALITVWKTLEKKPGAHAPYYAAAVKSRIRDVAWGGKPLTGGDSTPGPKSRPIEREVDWQDPIEQEIYSHLLEAADLLSGVEWSYHHGEIFEALRALPEADREYVVRRFWHGQSDTEIAAIRGVTNKMLGNRWSRTIRPVLTERLAHLAGAG